MVRQPHQVIRADLPEQHIAGTVDATPGLILQAMLSGALGGLFAAFFPVVTGGVGGLLVCLAATGIGLIPGLWGSRRMNAMGILLLPIALNMSGLGDLVARWLALL